MLLAPAAASAFLYINPPRHPSVAMADADGVSGPVLRVDGETPFFWHNGQLERCSSSAQFHLARATNYGTGYVQVIDQTGISTEIRNRRLGGISTTYSGEYHCTLIAQENHPDCFLAVLFYRADRNGDVQPATLALAFKAIGDLHAGVPAKVDIYRSYVFAKGEAAYMCPLVFTRGHELRTNWSDELDQILRNVEMTVHATMLDAYRRQFPDQDRAATCYLRMPPIVDASIRPENVPATLIVQYTVAPDGTVMHVLVPNDTDPTLAAAVERAVGGWLYLPRLVHGVASSSTVRLQLLFPKEKGA